MLDNASRIPVCRACLGLLTLYSGPMCEHCGLPFVTPLNSETSTESSPPQLCHICRRGLYDFNFARSYGIYTPEMARTIMLLKYHDVTPLGAWFAHRLKEVVRLRPEAYVADIVVPVPVHPARLKVRGYNQAERIARPLAHTLGVPFRSYLLMRIRPRPEKLRLTMRERWRTVRGAYAMQPGARVDNLRVLLVDDVLTTGATLDACSRALRQAGASNVVALTVARAVPRNVIQSAESPAMEPDE